MIALLNTAALFAQATLVADGRTDTYKLIDKSLGGMAEETPDCSHPDFGPHITQVFDSDMGQPVFLFIFTPLRTTTAAWPSTGKGRRSRRMVLLPTI